MSYSVDPVAADQTRILQIDGQLAHRDAGWNQVILSTVHKAEFKNFYKVKVELK